MFINEYIKNKRDINSISKLSDFICKFYMHNFTPVW